jgi:alkylation response protein AidB-like acyl-CoA dehydrogenase
LCDDLLSFAWVHCEDDGRGARSAGLTRGSTGQHLPVGLEVVTGVQVHRDAKIYWLFEGTSEIRRLVISRANGGMA